MVKKTYTVTGLAVEAEYSDREVEALSDCTVAINAAMNELEERLIERKQKGGTSLQEAYQHVLRTDKPNAELVLNCSQPADMFMQLEKGRLIKKEKGQQSI